MSSGFISETEAAELRKKRQEEWERVRKPSDPVGELSFAVKKAFMNQDKLVSSLY